MKLVFLLVTLMLGGLTEHAVASGTFSSTGTTTNATSTNADPKSGGASWGALTITGVIVNGTVQTKGVQYELVDDGTSEAKVHFFSALANGALVVVNGTTTNSGNHVGTVSFS